jgi:hypothetical protein
LCCGYLLLLLLPQLGVLRLLLLTLLLLGLLQVWLDECCCCIQACGLSPWVKLRQPRLQQVNQRTARGGVSEVRFKDHRGTDKPTGRHSDMQQ